MPVPDRWRRVDELFHRAIERPEKEREGFLESACAGDPELLADVLSLIRADEPAAGDRYERWAPRLAAAWVEEADAALVGRTIGRYRVLERLDAGSMGEVYRAADPVLGRDIALKILPARFLTDPDRVRRFAREARSASALNHPNIVTIHEIGVADGVHYIASELVEGETLRARLSRGRLTAREAIEVGIQIAAGLAAAHTAGAIHRDIKPENLMLRRDGLVKIVDFGLAKLIEPEGAAAGAGSHPTHADIVLGTLSYMSPEQALGETLDARTDLFSLGVVLYEMVTGELPHSGSSDAARYDALLNKPPRPPGALVPGLDPELGRVLARALEKDGELRYQTAADFGADLKRLSRGSRWGTQRAPSEPGDFDRDRAIRPDAGHTRAAIESTREVRAVRPARRAAARRWGAPALILGVVAAFVLFGLARPDSPRAGDLDVSRLAFIRVTEQAGEELFPSLAPAGNVVVYSSGGEAGWDIYSQRVGGSSAVNLTRDSPGDDIQPVYAPDGNRILFRSEREGGGLFTMGATGESVKRVTDFGFDPAWSPDGRQIVCSTARVQPTTVRLPPSDLWIVDVATGRRRLLTSGPAYQPQWSPNGMRIAFFRPDAAGNRHIWTIAADGGAATPVTAGAHVDLNPVWSRDGRSLYFLSDRSGVTNVWRLRIDEHRGTPLGDPEPFLLPAAAVVHLSRVAGTDQLAYVSQSGGAIIERFELDAAGVTVVGRLAVTPRSRSMIQPDISPDASLLAVATRGEVREDVWILRADGTPVRALTDDEPRDRAPRWSPDGRRIAFQSERTGRNEIFLINADGSGLEQLTATATGTPCCPVWSPDGGRIAYLAPDLSLRVLHIGDRRSGPYPDALLGGVPDGTWFEPTSWSPDGRRLAGQTRRGNNPHGGIGVFELDSGRYDSLTTAGGGPVWLKDGRRLVYQEPRSYHVIDSTSRNVRQLLSVAPYQAGGLTLTRDNRYLYANVRAVESDVWIATAR